MKGLDFEVLFHGVIAHHAAKVHAAFRIF